MSRFIQYGAIAGIIAGFALVTTIGAQQVNHTAAKVDATVLKNTGTSKDALAGSWLSYGRTQGETRYSPLDQIDVSNVGRLGLAWTYTLGAGGGNQEGTPLVWNNTIYSITNWSVVFALDARNGKELWRWDPEVNQAAVRPKMCCGIVNRGLAMYNGMIFAPINDGRLEALDALTGKVIWEARLAYPQDWYSLTMAPRVANGKVIIGAAGGDHPTRGFFDAYDAATGHRAWRFYTVPGNPANPYENDAMRKAGKTWGGDFWKMGGGGSVWDGMAYDPEADLIYVGTGNAEPWVQKFRGAQGLDNLYTCSILAVQVSTGQLKWHYQAVPNDNWDFDAVQQLMLADLTINGKPRKVLMQASKDGFFYVLDRITGQFISGTPFAQVNWAHGFDEVGRPMINPAAFYGKDPITIYPTAGGAHNWSPMSWNPATGLVYIPTTYASWTFAAGDEVIPAPTGHTGLAPGFLAPKPNNLPMMGPEPLGNNRGVLEAWNPVTRKLVWRTPGGGGIGGGTVSTAGNLVFQVTNDGHLLAYSADKGDKLLDIQTGRNGMAPPITYEIDGKQYVALAGGTGRPAMVVGPTDAKVDYPPLFFVFELDGNAPMPKAMPAPTFGRGRGPAPPPPPPTELHKDQ
ncbi:MAG TPA: PQQ-dependent dehydrogenase, methanol/ethanol family [Bryobacteraceae bacterium]|jgi:quinohemoprotein ethanol dehydrogenase|nr:PQQ-dependent dehydrogenase, methanol/ethanol family [Bryobacteraceae bacterium]